MFYLASSYKLNCIFNIFIIWMPFCNSTNQFKWTKCVITLASEFSNYLRMLLTQNLLYGFIVRISTISTNQKYLFVVW